MTSGRGEEYRRGRRVVERERRVGGADGVQVRLGIPSRRLEVGRDHGVRGGAAFLERHGHPCVQRLLLHRALMRPNGTRDLVVRELERCARPVVCRRQEPCVDEAARVLAQLLRPPPTRAPQQLLIEFATERSSQREHRLGFGREPSGTSDDERMERRRRRKLADRAPPPAFAIAAEVPALLQIAEKMRDVKRIALGMSIEVREQVATCCGEKFSSSSSDPPLEHLESLAIRQRFDVDVGAVDHWKSAILSLECEKQIRAAENDRVSSLQTEIHFVVSLCDRRAA